MKLFARRMILLCFVCLAMVSPSYAAPGEESPRVLRAIPYSANGGPAQQLDLYLPSVKGFPTVLFIHGGSLNSGDKQDEDYQGICDPFAKSGVACATINYRLFPAVKWPAPMQDTASAFAWLHSHIAEFGGSPSKIFVFGHSSGCLLASLLATDPTFLRENGLKLENIAGVVAMGCRLNAVVDTSGATPEQIQSHFARDPYDAGFGSIEALNNAVPTRHVNSNMPPFLILIAEAEQINPPILADAKEFIARAHAAGAIAEYVVLPGLKHYSSIHNARSKDDPTFRRILAFVVK